MEQLLYNNLNIAGSIAGYALTQINSLISNAITTIQNNVILTNLTTLGTSIMQAGLSVIGTLLVTGNLTVSRGISVSTGTAGFLTTVEAVSGTIF